MSDASEAFENAKAGAAELRALAAKLASRELNSSEAATLTAKSFELVAALLEKTLRLDERLTAIEKKLGQA